MLLGIEIGGTKLQLGVGDGTRAELAAFKRCDVDAGQGADGILRQVAELGRRLTAQYPITRVGVGFGGPVDERSGQILLSHQVPGWENFALADWVQRELGLSAVVANDADAAALAEARFGAGQGSDPVLYVTVGTGIGAGLVIGGRLYTGHGVARAELGHLRPGLSAADPGQTVEAVASGSGLARAARQAIAAQAPDEAHDLADFVDRCGGDVARLDGRLVAEAARAGNRVAGRLFGAGIQTLGWAIAQAITLLSPQVVVVGGGVSLAGEALFFDPLRSAVGRYVFPPLADHCPIVPAALGELMVVHGALALAAEAE